MGRGLIVLIICGCVLRVAALPLPGTEDVAVFKAWSRQAVLGGPTRVYSGEPSPVPGLTYFGQMMTVTYPPLALYELALAGFAYRHWSPSFRETPALTVMVKVLPVLADAGLAALIFWSVRRFDLSNHGDRAGVWRAVFRYWLNPAVIITAAVLGYTDPSFALPAVAALLLVPLGYPGAAGALLGAALMTKPQAVLIGPAVLIAIWCGRDRWRGIAAAAAGGAAMIAVILAPLLAAGAGRDVVGAFRTLTGQDFLSGNAANLWWIVGYLFEARRAHWFMSLSTALARPAAFVRLTTVMASGWPDPRAGATAGVIVLVAWAMFRILRGRVDIISLAGLGALVAHGYFVLAVNVHENHLFLALPLLALAAAARASYRPLFWTVSFIHGLNLNLFYGLGGGVWQRYAVPRAVTPIDATVVLACVNLVALAWHVRIFNVECRRSSAMSSTAVTEKSHRWSPRLT